MPVRRHRFIYLSVVIYCMNELPKFNGRSLIETPDVPMIGYLEGDFGKKFLET